MTEDLGLFGPDSVTWRIHADPSMLIGGIRALLVQALHPLAMAGVAQHSDYQGDPWGRLQRTVDYVVTTTFADTPTALFEASVAQWYWLKDTHPAADQFNSIHEKLIARWKQLSTNGQVHFAACYEQAEDRATCEYLRDTATQAGLQTSALDIEDIGWSGADFIDLDGPLWLEDDYPDGVTLQRGVLMPPSPGFWGG